jgi:hypothetical protein
LFSSTVNRYEDNCQNREIFSLHILLEIRLTPQDVEPDGLGQRSALTDDDLVTGVDSESGGTVNGEVLVPLLVTPVLGDAVERREDHRSA